MRAFLVCLLISMFPAAAQAAIVQLEVRPGITASAEYLIGERSKPAVLLIHGFLQTREFPTVATLARGLQDASYTVLSPTLSLNIPSRTQSLACEAVHKHSMDEDVDEIGRWVRWLKSNGHRDIVLLGHSFGSLQLLAYLSEQTGCGRQRLYRRFADRGSGRHGFASRPDRATGKPRPQQAARIGDPYPVLLQEVHLDTSGSAVVCTLGPATPAGCSETIPG